MKKRVYLADAAEYRSVHIKQKRYGRAFAHSVFVWRSNSAPAPLERIGGLFLNKQWDVFDCHI